MSYHELSLEERSNIQVGLLRGMSQRAIARMLNRSPSTICREIRRNRGAQGEYITQHAQRATCERRMPPPRCQDSCRLIGFTTLIHRGRKESCNAALFT